MASPAGLKQSLGTETCLTEWRGMSATSVVALLAGSWRCEHAEVQEWVLRVGSGSRPRNSSASSGFLVWRPHPSLPQNLLGSVSRYLVWGQLCAHIRELLSGQLLPWRSGGKGLCSWLAYTFVYSKLVALQMGAAPEKRCPVMYQDFSGLFPVLWHLPCACGVFVVLLFHTFKIPFIFILK